MSAKKNKTIIKKNKIKDEIIEYCESSLRANKQNYFFDEIICALSSLAQKYNVPLKKDLSFNLPFRTAFLEFKENKKGFQFTIQQLYNSILNERQIRP